MEEVYGVGPRNLRTNFRLEEIFSARNVFRKSDEKVNDWKEFSIQIVLLFQ